MKPTALIDGLAVYKVGQGEAIFYMPYPHASTEVPTSENQLTKALNTINKSVITFDPPGSFASTRPATVELEEMIVCAEDTLDHFGIKGRIDMVGHSMGSLCLIAFSVENPNRVKRMALIGTSSGWPAIKRWGIHKSWKWWRDKEYWQVMVWGTRIVLGLDNLYIHKRLDHLVDYASFVDKKYVPPLEIEKSNKKKSAPPRAKWLQTLRKRRIDYYPKLDLIRCPVLICAGAHDPQTPLVMNEQINEGIPFAKLVIFQESGHSPFIEEREKFIQTVGDFLS